MRLAERLLRKGYDLGQTQVGKAKLERLLRVAQVRIGTNQELFHERGWQAQKHLGIGKGERGANHRKVMCLMICGDTDSEITYSSRYLLSGNN